MGCCVFEAVEDNNVTEFELTALLAFDSCWRAAGFCC